MSLESHRIRIRQTPNKTAMMVLMKCIAFWQRGGVLGAGLTDWPTKKQKPDVGCNNNYSSSSNSSNIEGIAWLPCCCLWADCRCCSNVLLLLPLLGCHNYGRRANILFTFGAHCRQAATTTTAAATKATAMARQQHQRNSSNTSKKSLISRAPPTRAVSHMCVQFAHMPQVRSHSRFKTPSPPKKKINTLPRRQFSSGCLLLLFCFWAYILTLLLLLLVLPLQLATPEKKTAKSAKC